jgi:hypothetical protein
MGFLKTLFPSKNERDIAQLEKIADKIEALSETYSKMSDDELKGCTQKFKDQLNNGKTLDDLLPDAFAVVRLQPVTDAFKAVMRSLERPYIHARKFYAAACFKVMYVICVKCGEIAKYSVYSAAVCINRYPVP